MNFLSEEKIFMKLFCPPINVILNYYQVPCFSINLPEVYVFFKICNCPKTFTPNISLLVIPK